MHYISLYSQIASLLILGISIVLLVGIIWRVEMKLDLSFKLFFAAILFLIIADGLNLFVDTAYLIEISKNLVKLISSLIFLAGVVVMHNMLREIDGEK